MNSYGMDVREREDPEDRGFAAAPTTKPKRRHLVSITLWVELESGGDLQDAVNKLHLQATHMLPAMGVKPHRNPQVVLLEEIKK